MQTKDINEPNKLTRPSCGDGHEENEIKCVSHIEKKDCTPECWAGSGFGMLIKISVLWWTFHASAEQMIVKACSNSATAWNAPHVLQNVPYFSLILKWLANKYNRHAVSYRLNEFFSHFLKVIEFGRHQQINWRRYKSSRFKWCSTKKKKNIRNKRRQNMNFIAVLLLFWSDTLVSSVFIVGRVSPDLVWWQRRQHGHNVNFYYDRWQILFPIIDFLWCARHSLIHSSAKKHTDISSPEIYG